MLAERAQFRLRRAAEHGKQALLDFSRGSLFRVGVHPALALFAQRAVFIGLRDPLAIQRYVARHGARLVGDAAAAAGELDLRKSRFQQYAALREIGANCSAYMSGKGTMFILLLADLELRALDTDRRL
jgi:hypothetical protein